MTEWMSHELATIEAADELQIASLRHDGRLRKPVTTWVVRLGDDLYVRSVNGPDGAWLCGTQAAYRSKHRRYGSSIVGSIVTPEARSATIKLLPRE